MTRGLAHKHDDASIIKACELREGGLSVGQISVRMGIPRSTIEWHCIKAGAEPPRIQQQHYNPRPLRYRHGLPVRMFSEAEDLQLSGLEAAGMRLCDMAAKLGRHPSSIRNRLMLLARQQARRERAQASEGIL